MDILEPLLRLILLDLDHEDALVAIFEDYQTQHRSCSAVIIRSLRGLSGSVFGFSGIPAETHKPH